MLVQRVEYTFRISIALQFNQHTHPMAVRLVTYLGDTIDLLVTSQFCDLLDQVGLIHLVGQFGDDDAQATSLRFFDLYTSTYNDAPTTTGISIANAFPPMNNATGWKVWATYNA